MTISYTFDVANAGMSMLSKILFRWRGSIWKAVYIELFIWLGAYAVLALVYYHLLTEAQQHTFEQLCQFFRKYEDFLPVTFLLGFFVTMVATRWWNMFDNIGWIDLPALYISNHIHGEDDQSRLLRRNIVRHLLFYQVLVYRDISVCIRERFPTLETCVTAGYITDDELKTFNDQNSHFPQYWVPISWVMNNLRRAYREGRIQSPQSLQDMQNRVLDFRGNLGTLLGYDWVPVPLVYAQVVAISVRLYFVIALLGRQNLLRANKDDYLDPINLYFPIMSTCQFVFYIGWLKVAESLLNPFGGDDDDFEINWLLDRNLEVGYMIVEDREGVPLIKDPFWKDNVVQSFYSEETANTEHNPMIGSAVNMKIRKDSSVVMVPRSEEDFIPDRKMSRSLSIFKDLQGSFNRRMSRIRGSVFPEDSVDDHKMENEEFKKESRGSRGSAAARSRRGSERQTGTVRQNSHASHNGAPTGELHVVVEEDDSQKAFSRHSTTEAESDDEETHTSRI